ncbi:hypothetical protein KW782_04675 [Candidatus Parcubacteria bacterium]|nr:hypothetical protein [Candidatus Parcubacteria bacterium]
MNENQEQASLALKYFLDNFPIEVLLDQTKPSKKIDELAHFYLGRLTEVFSVFDRLIRYEHYFEKFYPPTDSDIPESEALEYHLRSYIEDFYILQERIKKITKRLIDDLSYYSIENESDVREALENMLNAIHEGLKDITDVLRREHVHEHSISELDFSTGKFLNMLLSGKFPLPDGATLPREKVQQRLSEVTVRLKAKHVAQAKRNSESLRKTKEWFASRFIYLFSILNGHKIEGLKMKSGASNKNEDYGV